MKLSLMILITAICSVAHAAEETFDRKLKTLIERNQIAPALPASCRGQRCGIIAKIFSQPLTCYEASPEDNMLDYLAQRLLYNKATLAHAEHNHVTRRALVTEYLKHHKLALHNSCCGPTLPLLPHTLTAITCCACYLESMQRCPHFFDQFVEHPDTSPGITAAASLFAAQFACKAAQLCCIRFMHEDEDKLG